MASSKFLTYLVREHLLVPFVRRVCDFNDKYRQNINYKCNKGTNCTYHAPIVSMYKLLYRVDYIPFARTKHFCRESLYAVCLNPIDRINHDFVLIDRFSIR